MLGTGKLKSGRKVLYKDSELKNAYPKPANSTPTVDILEESVKGYKVFVHHTSFNPQTVWVAKGNVVNIVWKKLNNSKISVGSKVKIKNSASKYATGQTIPNSIKGKTDVVQELANDRALLKGIYSWVYLKDLELVSSGTTTVKPVEKVEIFEGDKMVLYRGKTKLGEFTFKKG